MAQWTPDPKAIGKGEVIGRRVLKDPIFDDDLGQGQKGRLRLDHFYDNRLAENLSVDRLGRSGQPEKKIVNRVANIADEEHALAASPNFHGWGALRAATLTQRSSAPIPVLATPTVQNPFHSDISRDKFRETQQAWALAYQLRDIVQNEFGLVERPLARKESKKQSLFARIFSAVVRRF